MSDDRHDAPLTNEGVEYENKDLKIGWLAASAIILLLLTVAAMALIGGFLGRLEASHAAMQPTPLPLLEDRPTPPPPRLQPNILDRRTAEEDMEQMRAREDRILNNFAWVDEEAGVVRVPIDFAIEVLTPDDEPAR